MKSLVPIVQRLAGALGGDDARRLSAAVALLLVLGAAPAAYSSEPPGSTPTTRTEEGDNDDDDGGDDSASGDETVGTLPSVADESGFDFLGGTALANLRGFAPDGSLTFEGRAADIAALLARTRSDGFSALELLDGDRMRLRLLGDFRVAIPPELLSRLKTTLQVAGGLEVRISWRQRGSTFLLGGGSELGIPLATLARSGDLQGVPLRVESVNLGGVRTRLAARMEAGLLVLTQERGY
jgi:hypothetical protein